MNSHLTSLDRHPANHAGRAPVRIAARLVLVAALLTGGGRAWAADSQPLPVEWDKATSSNRSEKIMHYSAAVLDENGQSVLQVKAVPVKEAKWTGTTGAVGLTCLPVGPVAAGSAGISFEFKGDGSAHFASVFVGRDNNLLNSFEAFFPLDSTEWRSMTLRWTDFVNNALPWDKQARLSVADMTVAPAEIKVIGFGRANCNHKFYTPTFGFAIRNVRLVATRPDHPVSAYSKGLSHTTKLIQQKKPLNILMLGDSITDLGDAQSQGYHCAQLIQQKWGVPCRVVNAGVGGQTARFATISLPRALRLMPNPDLVCIMYGANDCKAATGEFNQSGFNEEAFAKNLELLIDQIRRATDGKTDIVLLSGVPRLDKKAGKTTGAVEKIVGAYKKVAAKKATALCETFPVYLKLPAAKKMAYYRDTIHQSQPGLVFIGQLLFSTIRSAPPLHGVQRRQGRPAVGRSGKVGTRPRQAVPNGTEGAGIRGISCTDAVVA
jgi:lysophospholipase L1-like esterase